MAALYITSSKAGAGKTAMGAGLARHLLNSGKKVGFLRPLITDSGEAAADGSSRDAVFMKTVLALAEPVEILSPVISERSNPITKINEAYAEVSPGKDVVIVEGSLNDTAQGIVETLNARMIIVEGYSQLPDVEPADMYSGVGERLLGIVLNKVPGSRAEHVSGKLGKQVLGVLPEDRVLFTLTIGELAESLPGEILNSADKSDELVENFMLGAMIVDHGPAYYGRKANKAVVVRGDRPDMQVAALETSTRCLILCGNEAPIQPVLYQAENKGIPLILTRGDTASTVASIEEALAKTRFNQEKKLPRLVEIMGKHFDFPAVYSGLGLAA